jgi:hypothetical protein
MIRRCDRHSIDGRIVENAAEIGDAVCAAGSAHSFGKSLLIDVGHLHNL